MSLSMRLGFAVEFMPDAVPDKLLASSWSQYTLQNAEQLGILDGNGCGEDSGVQGGRGMSEESWPSVWLHFGRMLCVLRGSATRIRGPGKKMYTLDQGKV